MHTALYYTTPHYSQLGYTTIHYTILCMLLHSPQYTTVLLLTLLYIATLHCITLHYITKLHYTRLHYYTTLNHILWMLHYATFYSTLNYTTLYYIHCKRSRWVFLLNWRYINLQLRLQLQYPHDIVATTLNYTALLHTRPPCGILCYVTLHIHVSSGSSLS